MSTPASAERLLSTQEAAEMLGVSRWWFYHHPEIPRLRVGRLTKFRPADIAEYVREREIREEVGVR